MDREFCIKCGNINKFVSEHNKLYKQCSICNYKEEASVNDYKIITEDYVQKGESYSYYLGSIINDRTFPLIEKNNKLYTVFVEPDTMRFLYISNDTNKVYEQIPE